MEKYTYSVIIPTKNIPELLTRTLNSIPQRHDIQVIVVDDNSDSGKVDFEHYPGLGRENTLVIFNKEGLGAGHARNIGLRNASGKWLIFADSDDFFVKDVDRIWDEYHNSDVDIIYFNVKSCYSDDTNQMYHDSKNILFERFCKNGDDRLFRLGYTEPWGKMIKRDFVLGNGILFQETVAHNDFLFSVKTGLLASKVLAVNKQIYWYVFRKGSLGNHVGKESIMKVEDRVKAFNEVWKFVKKYDIRTRDYLPAIPCRRVILRDILTFFKMWPFFRRNEISISFVVLDFFKYAIKRMTKREPLEIYDQFVL